MPELVRTFDCDADPVESTRLQRMGVGDPTLRLDGHRVVRTVHTPEGPATLEVEWRDARAVAKAWGSGASWVLERAPGFCGAEDTAEGFAPEPTWLGDLAREHAAMRMGQALRLFDVVVAYVLQQRVAFVDAARSWKALVERHGESAPGPFEMRLPLLPEQWRRLPSAAMAAVGIDGQRARIVHEVALHARKIDRLSEQGLARARELLPRLRGIGPWTAGMVLAVGCGDADAVAPGDVRLPHLVSEAFLPAPPMPFLPTPPMPFTGRPRGTDRQMLALLEPYRPHRFRIVRLVFAAASGRRRTPRRAVRRA